MWGLIVALEYIGGAAAIATGEAPGLAMVAVCVADLIMKAVRNARINRRLTEMTARYEAMFGSGQAVNVTEAGRLAGFAAHGTAGAGVGMALGVTLDAYFNARDEKQMGAEQRTLHQEIRRVARTKSSYRLTFVLFAWLAIVWGARGLVQGLLG